MARKQKNTRKKVTRLHAITQTAKAANHFVLFVAFAVSALVIGALSLPEKRKVSKLKADYEESLLKNEKAQSQFDALQVELKALKEDPKYLEVRARDRWPISFEGEKVIQIQR